MLASGMLQDTMLLGAALLVMAVVCGFEGWSG